MNASCTICATMKRRCIKLAKISMDNSPSYSLKSSVIMADFRNPRMLFIWINRILNEFLMQQNNCPGGQAVLGGWFESDGSLVRFLSETYIFILNFLLVSHSSQLGRVHAIKHSPIVIVVLDPRSINYSSHVYINNRRISLRWIGHLKIKLNLHDYGPYAHFGY